MSFCSLFLFVAMQKERVNRERKTRYLFAILWIAQALTGALRAVAVFYPSPLWGNKANQRGTSCVSLFPKRSAGEGVT